jgi:hypothetical protein
MGVDTVEKGREKGEMVKSGRVAWCVLFLSVSCIFSAGQAIGGSGKLPSTVAPVQDYSRTGHFYFGTAQTTKHCPTAWLLYLDPASKSGGVFVAAKIERFSNVDFARGGTLTFGWTGLGDRVYRFSGAFHSGVLSGEVDSVNGGWRTLS